MLRRDRNFFVEESKSIFCSWFLIPILMARIDPSLVNIVLQWLIVGQMHTIYLQLLNYSTAFATVECTIRAEVVYCEAKQFQKSFSGMVKLSL